MTNCFKQFLRSPLPAAHCLPPLPPPSRPPANPPTQHHTTHHPNADPLPQRDPPYTSPTEFSMVLLATASFLSNSNSSSKGPSAHLRFLPVVGFGCLVFVVELFMLITPWSTSLKKKTIPVSKSFSLKNLTELKKMSAKKKVTDVLNSKNIESAPRQFCIYFRRNGIDSTQRSQSVAAFPLTEDGPLISGLPKPPV